jgi:hypothetical protein
MTTQVKITGLPVASSVSTSDLLPIVSVAGPTTQKATVTQVFDGYAGNSPGLTFSGSLTAAMGLSGSLTKLSNGSSYLVPSGTVTVTSSSNGQIVIGSGAVPIELVFTAGQQTIGVNTFVRVGARQVDVSQYPATRGQLTRVIKFVVDIDKTSGATNVEVKLSDLTHSVDVTGADLTSTSVTSSEVTSAALTVGSAAGNIRNDSLTQYEVYCKMNGGVIDTDHVSCTGARLVITYV